MKFLADEGIEGFLLPLEITAYRLAKNLEIPQTRVSEIIHGRRRITADTALRLGKHFGTTAQFWLNLQNDYDLEEEQARIKVELDRIKEIKTSAA